MLIASCAVTQHHKQHGCVFFTVPHLPHNIFTHAVEILTWKDCTWSLLSRAVWLSQPPLMWQIFQARNHHFDLLQDSLQYVLVCLALGSPKMESAFHISHQHWVEEQDHLLRPAGSSPNAARCYCPRVQQDVLLASSTWCLRKQSLLVFAKLLSSHLIPTLSLVHKIILFHMQDIFFLLSFVKSWAAHLAYMTGSLWTAAQPSALPAAFPSSL